MDNKKGKSIAMKLLDDLLDDDESTTDAKPSKQDQIPSPPSRGRETKPPNPSPLTQTTKIEQPTNISLVDFSNPSHEKTSSQSDDQTLKLNQSKIVGSSESKALYEKSGTRPPEVRSTVGRASPLRPGGTASPTDISLATAENLRIAQQRILELEQEIERLRSENEQLGAAGETLRRRADELMTQANQLQGKLKQTADTNEQEIDILRQTLAQKDTELTAAKMKNEEMEMRLSTNIHKIRVRERELENRLELAKMESSAILRSKDEALLDLKRQLDQLTIELENYRNKGQELNKQLGDRQEMLRRTVKALRIALSMLEGEDEVGPSPAQKKVK